MHIGPERVTKASILLRSPGKEFSFLELSRPLTRLAGAIGTPNAKLCFEWAAQRKSLKATSACRAPLDSLALLMYIITCLLDAVGLPDQLASDH